MTPTEIGSLIITLDRIVSNPRVTPRQRRNALQLAFDTGASHGACEALERFTRRLEQQDEPVKPQAVDIVRGVVTSVLSRAIAAGEIDATGFPYRP